MESSSGTNYLALCLSADCCCRCAPCRAFTPTLIAAYNAARKEGLPFELVFVSADHDQEGFDKYTENMPWPAVKFEVSTCCCCGEALRSSEVRASADSVHSLSFCVRPLLLLPRPCSLRTCARASVSSSQRRVSRCSTSSEPTVCSSRRKGDKLWRKTRKRRSEGGLRLSCLLQLLHRLQRSPRMHSRWMRTSKSGCTAAEPRMRALRSPPPHCLPPSVRESITRRHCIVSNQCVKGCWSISEAKRAQARATMEWQRETAAQLR